MSIDSDAGFLFTNNVPYPDNESVNASGPSATDGTEFVKLMIDNYMFGPMQAILDRAFLTPNGVTEAAGASQVIDALQLGVAMPAGTGTEWMNAADPAVTGHRCLLRQGQGILIANYLDLDDAVYVGDANNVAVHAGGGAFYHASDAAGTTPNIAGPYLILDDARGVVARGLDSAGAIDPDGASRFLGDLQVDAFQGHISHIETSDGTNNIWVSAASGTGASANGGTFTTGGTATAATMETTVPVSDGVNGTPRTAAETRGYNRATNEVIWY